MVSPIAYLNFGVLCLAQTCYYKQVHLSYGNNVSEVIVTYSTFDTVSVLQPTVWYKENNTDDKYRQVFGTASLFVDGGPKKHKQFISRVKLTNLKPDTSYLYYVRLVNMSRQAYSFRTPKPNPSLVIFGDLGKENAQSLDRLIKDTQSGMYDAALHVGDFAYDMDSDNAEVGDAFMRQIEPVAAYIPYMTCPGNHEEKYNFSNYRNRFSMPGGRDIPYYSFNLGNLHIISISTEVYYFINYGIKEMVNQYYWLESDLKEANKPENRKKQPWIIIMGHRPMYCTNDNPADCKRHSTFTRVGIPYFHIFGLEPLLYKYGVDLAIWAHEHSYERLWPIYNYHVYNGSIDEPYRNPMAPVHITTGSAGCKEGRSPFNNNTWPAFSAFRSSDYGYTRFKSYNNSHVYLEQVSDDKNGDIIDSFWIIKEGKNGPYPKFYNSSMD
ncbi:acid phosphatase type 7 [Agrilus planipennis]|uniref:Purple acid phosphatase n=1 Tax=Agrilus planipennis TaxID=224129 RepID=A0A1W4WFP0_AGRPL|nr:acid phosphatase type 7 [Agrilus planipennis]